MLTPREPEGPPPVRLREKRPASTFARDRPPKLTCYGVPQRDQRESGGRPSQRVHLSEAPAPVPQQSVRPRGISEAQLWDNDGAYIIRYLLSECSGHRESREEKRVWRAINMQDEQLKEQLWRMGNLEPEEMYNDRRAGDIDRWTCYTYRLELGDDLRKLKDPSTGSFQTVNGLFRE